MKKLTYLACPYSHPDPDVREQRFRAVNKAAGKLMLEGHLVFSPISHTHPIAVDCDLPKGWDFWHAYDRAFIEASCKLVVLMLDGWTDSVGVKAEIAIATELGIPVEYIGPEAAIGERIQARTPNAVLANTPRIQWANGHVRVDRGSHRKSQGHRRLALRRYTRC